MKKLSRNGQVLIGAIAVLLLTALSMAAIALLGGGTTPGGAGNPGTTRCVAPSFAGTVVNVTATDRGGSMMGGPKMMRGSMRLSADRTTVAHGKVTFLVTNAGTIPHEMLLLPLAGTQSAGTRPVGRDGRTDETGSLGEASATCGEGGGEGVLPSAAGWVTLDLQPGRYELVCNLPGHYRAGMYTELTVT
ncbi:sulfocyanin SoxE-like protein [Arthrobacter sp. SLBN-100]|uniref:sulfocyanin-like copper-binding protein n=1 Tax=Arthrobacter sp. SLBN-100 TaxID=2768450 RepID=UPI0011506882|nr:sulfocyanin-like copper-binding protein [Arthrobacter sp. SLBN-100]TQJ67811.1 sulfocyanin SoxE-like protein [Arthrobacter sp. SLBN-100]